MLDKRDRAVAFVFRRDLHLILLCCGLFQKICLKEGKGWWKFFSNMLLSRLSHKVRRLLSSPVLLRMRTEVSQLKQCLNLVTTKFPVLQLIFLSPHLVSPLLAWGDFHARSRFARSTIPEEKWGLLVVYKRGWRGETLKSSFTNCLLVCFLVFDVVVIFL